MRDVSEFQFYNIHHIYLLFLNLPCKSTTPSNVPNVPIATMATFLNATTNSHHSLPGLYPIYNRPNLRRIFSDLIFSGCLLPKLLSSCK